MRCTRNVRHLFGLILVILTTLAWNLYSVVSQSSAIESARMANSRDYSFVGDDFPGELPGSYDSVAMIINDTSDRYPLTDSHAWASMYPMLNGFIRLGPQGRPFGVELYHQIHCLNTLRFSYVKARDGLVTDPEILKAQLHHASHCFQALRQSLLCKGDLTLEPLGRDESGTAEEALPHAHRCRDWTAVRRFVENNHEIWRDILLVVDPQLISNVSAT